MQVILDKNLDNRVIMSNVKSFQVKSPYAIIKLAKNANLKAYIELLKTERYSWSITDQDEYDATLVVYLNGVTVNVY